MPYYSRKKFVKTSAVLLATALTGTAFDFKKRKNLLSFSTLGCPDWTFTQIMEFASKHHYNGIEVRGIQRQMDVTKCNEFSNQQIKATLQLMKDKKLAFVNLGSSATMHFADGAEREKKLDEAKQYIDLAAQLNCPFIRVFPNNFLKSQERQQTIDLIVKGLVALGNYAKGTGVKVLMETHGDLVYKEDLYNIMNNVAHPDAGLVWDVSNMWTVKKESPAEVYNKLKHYIHHTHIKDAKQVEGKLKYTFLGTGDVPLTEAINALQNSNYKGYYSFEWEKLWHPEIEEPEIALADYTVKMKKYFKK